MDMINFCFRNKRRYRSAILYIVIKECRGQLQKMLDTEIVMFHGSWNNIVIIFINFFKVRVQDLAEVFSSSNF